MSAARDRSAEVTVSMRGEHCDACGCVLVWSDEILVCPRRTCSAWCGPGSTRTQASQATRQSDHHGGDHER